MNNLARFILIVALPLPLLASTSESAPGTTSVQSVANPMHPSFALLDEQGHSIQTSGAELSVNKTCGACHDADYINSNNQHWVDGIHANCLQCHMAPGTPAWTIDSLGPDGLLRKEAVQLTSATPEQCAQCHGLVHAARPPLSLPDDFSTRMATGTDPQEYDWTRATGEIFSGQKIEESYLNLQDRDSQKQPFDAHASRMVSCSSCHYSSNNPARNDHVQGQLSYLQKDPRKLTFSQYLQRPNHKLVNAQCTDCHSPLAGHKFLTQRERHMEVLSCQACHVPSLHGPAAKLEDRTLPLPGASDIRTWRNLEGDDGQPISARFISAYSPFLLPHAEINGTPRLSPFNLVTRYEWVEAGTGRPVDIAVVRAALLQNDAIHPRLSALLDTNANGHIEPQEAVLDTQEKQNLVKDLLMASGVAQPEIRGHSEAFKVAHGIVGAETAVRDCEACHGRDSRLSGDIDIGEVPHAFPSPTAGPVASTLLGGQLAITDGRIQWKRADDFHELYVFGYSRRGWSDLAGLVLFSFASLFVLLHAGRRIATRNRRKQVHSETVRVYLYSTYERLWHWLMAFTVILLMLTGFEVHYPDYVTLLGYRNAVSIHNFVAVVMVANAFLALFYHLSSNAIRQFIPGRSRFLEELLAQAKYYSYGIFIGAPHPIKKTRQRKLNPLQQVTYLGLLNVLFPLQVITGVIIWMSSRWPGVFESIGGLKFIAPVHNVGSWMFLTFLVIHVYLITTGHTLTSNLSAMVDGYDELDKDHDETTEG